MKFLYPSNPSNKNKVDSIFEEEFKINGGNLFSFEYFKEGKFNLIGSFNKNEEIVYRGWMMTLEEYLRLDTALSFLELHLLTKPNDYLACHQSGCHLQQNFKKYSPEIVRIDNQTLDLYTDLELSNMLCHFYFDWKGFFFKDYVKSLGKDSIVNGKPSVEDIHRIRGLFIKRKGFIEGGLCIKEVEEYKPESEKRFFVFKGKVNYINKYIPKMVYEIAKELKQYPFFSIDIAERIDGKLRLIEIGDGQVSDLKEWTVDKFCNIFK